MPAVPCQRLSHMYQCAPLSPEILQLIVLSNRGREEVQNDVTIASARSMRSLVPEQITK